EVDCSYDPAIFARLDAIRNAKRPAGPDDYVFTDCGRQPLSQEWLHKRVWLPTLRRAGLRARGPYSVRDSFISIALSAGEDPGWVAKVCGTSEEMIFRHYRTWIPGLNPDAGRKVSRVLGTVGGGNPPPDASPVASPAPKSTAEAQRDQLLKRVEAGGIEPPSEGASAIASTCVARALLSPRSLPQAGSRAASRRCVSAPAPPAAAGTQPAVMTLEPALRAQAGRARRSRWVGRFEDLPRRIPHGAHQRLCRPRAIARSTSRRSMRSRIAARLSWSFFPCPSPSSAFALPFDQYRRSGTSVKPRSWTLPRRRSSSRRCIRSFRVRSGSWPNWLAGP